VGSGESGEGLFLTRDADVLFFGGALAVDYKAAMAKVQAQNSPLGMVRGM